MSRILQCGYFMAHSDDALQYIGEEEMHLNYCEKRRENESKNKSSEGRRKERHQSVTPEEPARPSKGREEAVGGPGKG